MEMRRSPPPQALDAVDELLKLEAHVRQVEVLVDSAAVVDQAQLPVGGRGTRLLERADGHDKKGLRSRLETHGSELVPRLHSSTGGYEVGQPAPKRNLAARRRCAPIATRLLRCPSRKGF